MPRKFPLLLAACMLAALPALAAAPELQLVIRDHLFFPSVLEVPAGVKVRIVIDNQDPTPEEFESYELNREKVIPGKSKTVVFIGPLAPGEYPFFGEFNVRTAQGKVIAR
jgi:plastocyanin domain-containing protein